jgi:hypothetical protein
MMVVCRGRLSRPMTRSSPPVIIAWSTMMSA